MAKKSANIFVQNPGLMMVLTYFALLVVNIVVLFLANAFFPTQVVLGTFSITPTWALLHSMGMLALIGTFAIPFIHEIERWKGRDLTPKDWMIKYFIINFVGLWVISRFSEQFGLGLRSWMVAAVLALVLDFMQGGVMMQLEKLRTR